MAFNAGRLQTQDWRKQRVAHKQSPISSKLTTTSFTTLLCLVSPNLKIIKFTAQQFVTTINRAGWLQTHAHNLGDSGIRTNRGQFPPTCSPQPSSQTMPPCFHKRKDNQPQIPRHNQTPKWPSSMHLHRLQGCEQKEAQRSARTNPRFPNQNLDLAKTATTNKG